MRKKLIYLILALHFSCYTKAQDNTISRLDSTINTSLHEYWPNISANDSLLIFNRLITKSGYKQEDFYYSRRDSLGNWTKALPLSELNSFENEGAQTLSADGRFMVFASCNNKNSLGSCDLFYSIKIGGNWLPPRNLGKSINTRYWETQPSLSADGTELYFVSNRPSGKGGMDIWHTRLLDIDENGEMQWSTPQNLAINTTYNELSPFIHYDNETLYFASDNYSKPPQLDIFVSRKKQGIFSEHKSIGSPVNTASDELGFVVNAAGTLAYFSSERDKHNKDIYTFPLPQRFRPKAVQILKGRVFNAKTQSPLLAMLILRNTKDSTATYKAFTDMQTGEYLACVKKSSDWQLTVQADGFLYHTEDLEALQMQHKNIMLQPIKKGIALKLKYVFFDTDKSILKQESLRELQIVLELLQQHPSLKIELAGHTDNQGSIAYNQKLSEARAKAVKDWLIENGIAKNRLQAKGYGKSKPITTNRTEQDRAKNRRTELKVLDF